MFGCLNSCYSIHSEVLRGTAAERGVGLPKFILFWRNVTLQLKSFDEITRDHRHIFLSPHLDDVVYSCGGTLGVQVSTGIRPLVITVFAGVPSSNRHRGRRACRDEPSRVRAVVAR